MMDPKHIAIELSIVCDDFKNGAMRDLCTRIDKDDPTFRDEVKKIDNIINDISRISRETLNHSIVCVKRGKLSDSTRWVYLPKEVTPKVVGATPTSMIIGPATISMDGVLKELAKFNEPTTEEELMGIISKFLENYKNTTTNNYLIFNKEMPIGTLIRLVLQCGYTLPDMAKAMREIATEAKEMESVT